jgi:hypothetical protein
MRRVLIVISTALFRQLWRQFGWSDRGSIFFLYRRKEKPMRRLDRIHILFVQPVRVPPGGNSRRKRAKGFSA